MTSKREISARIAMEYITARASDIRDEAVEDAFDEATHHIPELVGGLTHLVVGLARRVAASEHITVEEALQREVLELVDDAPITPAKRPEIATPEPHELDPVRVRVRRLQVPKEAEAYEDDVELPPGEWTA